MSAERSFLDVLVIKLSFVRGVEDQNKVLTGAVQKDVFKQIKQVSKSENGDIISGEGVTKSGIES